MFHDAAVALQSARPASSLPSPNTGRARLPLAQARNTRFGHLEHQTPSPVHSTGNPPVVPNQTAGCRPGIPANDDGVSTLEDVSEPIGIRAEAQPSHSERSRGCESAGDNLHGPCYPQLPQGQGLCTKSDSVPDEYSLDALRRAPSLGHAEVDQTPQGGIDAWLDTVVPAADESETPPRESKRIEGRRHKESLAFGSATSTSAEQVSPQRSSSNKENIAPCDVPLHIRPRLTHLTASTPSRFCNPHTPSRSQSFRQDPQTPISLAHPTVPWGHQSVPTSRKRPTLAERLNAVSNRTARNNVQRSTPESIPGQKDGGRCKKSIGITPTSPGTRPTVRDFTVPEDTLISALANLSPSVELRRKGRRPQRERCVSYWDEDILDPESPAHPNKLVRNGKNMLDESTE
ncbi:MAG: hypothetical protein Q9163_002205 [Psora crenata]